MRGQVNFIRQGEGKDLFFLPCLEKYV